MRIQAVDERGGNLINVPDLSVVPFTGDVVVDIRGKEYFIVQRKWHLSENFVELRCEAVGGHK